MKEKASMLELVLVAAGLLLVGFVFGSDVAFGVLVLYLIFNMAMVMTYKGFS